MKNLEIKAAYADLKKLKRLVTEIGAVHIETKRQVDTYFHVQKGRLKLRDMGDKAYLVFYERGEKSKERWSNYYTYPVENTKEFRAYFNKALGTKVTVDKKRTLYMYKNARIHVDTVKNLGNFMEIEVEVKKGDQQAKALMKELLEHLQIPRTDFIKNSYSDLLLRK